MDLALQFGLPVGVLSRLMTERELRAWDRYDKRYMLPQRRMEFYAAQIAHTVAVTAGSKAPLSAFLFDPDAAPAKMPFDEDAEFNP